MESTTEKRTAGNGKRDKLSFIWYNDDAIFKYTDEDFDALAKSYADAGITVVMTFSCTHFRYTFFDYWDVILKCLSRLVAACHKYGIKVVEHSSASLTSNPQSEKEREAFSASLKSGSCGDCWKGVYEAAFDDNKILNTGMPISSFRQIDGRTGKWTISNYHGYSFCYNNPYFRESYFKYLEEVYKTGVDGIMCDDLQYWAGGNSCACEHCRRLFKEETGFDLPDPGHWSEFFNNFDDPRYVAWKQFKTRSTERFQRDVNRHFTSLGYKLLRPNYISDCLTSNWSCYPFESCRDLWDFVFQENCNALVIAVSFYGFAMEAIQRYAMTARDGKISYSLFYPDRPDSYYLSWALASAWGQDLIATSHDTETVGWETPYRAFDDLHFDLRENPVKVPDFTFYHSLKTRDCTDSGARMGAFYASMQQAYIAGFGIDLVFDDDPYEIIADKKRLVLAYVAMVSDDELEKLRRYVENGGELIILGEFASVKDDGSKRDFAEVFKAFGSSFGRVTYLPDRKNLAGLFCLALNRGATPPDVGSYPFSREEVRKAGRLFEELCKEKNAYADAEDKDLVLGFFRIKDGYALNIVNVTGLIPEQGGAFSHETPCGNFVKGAEKLPAFSVYAKCESAKSVRLYSPEIADEGIEVPFTIENGYVKADIPAGVFAGYAVLKIS